MEKEFGVSSFYTRLSRKTPSFHWPEISRERYTQNKYFLLTIQVVPLDLRLNALMAKYSIVVPLHNEEENVTQLYARLKQVMEQVGDSFELVLNSGSRIGPTDPLEEIAAVDSRVLVVELHRDFGQTSALAADSITPLANSVFAMDGDLQHNPNDIPAFIEKLDEGYEECRPRMAQQDTTTSSYAAHSLPLRKLAHGQAFRHLILTTSAPPSRPIAARSSIVFHSTSEMHRFIPALASWYGASICEVPIRNIIANPAEPLRNRPHLPRLSDLMTIRFLLKYMSRPLPLLRRIRAP